MTHDALDVLQRALANLYGVDAAEPVGPYVVDEGGLEAMSRSGAVRPRPGAREEVFVLDDGHEVSVAVFLDERARQAATDAVHGGTLALAAANFADFCVALEGISHFLLVQHRAVHGRPVTQLELELQAEVDKYVVARLSRWKHLVELSGDGHEPRVTASVLLDAPAPEADHLQAALFTDYALAPHLDDESSERYVTATRYAHRYCRALERRFLERGRTDRLHRDLRAFYRMGQADRLGHIGSVAR